MELNIVSLGMSLKNHNHLPLPQIRLQPFECFFFDTPTSDLPRHLDVTLVKCCLDVKVQSILCQSLKSTLIHIWTKAVMRVNVKWLRQSQAGYQ